MAKHLKNFRKQHIGILVKTTACGAPCLQRIKVYSEKLRILLLLWFLLCGGGALGMWPNIMPKKTAASAKISIVTGNVSDPNTEVF
jgi:hypothetical protein